MVVEVKIASFGKFLKIEIEIEILLSDFSLDTISSEARAPCEEDINLRTGRRDHRGRITGRLRFNWCPLIVNYQ